MPVYTEGKITSIRSKGPREGSKPDCLCRWVRAKYLTTKLSLRLHEKIYKCPTNSLSFDEKCINDIFFTVQIDYVGFQFFTKFFCIIMKKCTNLYYFLYVKSLAQNVKNQNCRKTFCISTAFLKKGKKKVVTQMRRENMGKKYPKFKETESNFISTVYPLSLTALIILCWFQIIMNF